MLISKIDITVMGVSIAVGGRDSEVRPDVWLLNSRRESLYLNGNIQIKYVFLYL